MKTIKKLTLSLLAVSTLLFATNTFADNHKYNKESKCGSGEYKKYKHCDVKSKKHHKGNKARLIIGAIYSLELTDAQEKKIDVIMEEYHAKRMKMNEAFKKDSFDKEAFIDARMNKKENRIKAKANLIEDIYTVLTSEQKAQLKEKIDNHFKDQKKR